MKDKVQESRLFFANLYFLNYRNEYRCQFACFLLDRAKLFSIEKLHLLKKLEPIGSFLQFLQPAFDLAYEIGVRFGIFGLTVVSPDRRARAQYLLADHLGLSSSRQRRI